MKKTISYKLRVTSDKKKKPKSYVLILTCILSLISCHFFSGCGEQEQPEVIKNATLARQVIDATGQSFDIDASPPERIISLTPSVTQNIYSLEEQDKLVGVTNYCQITPGDKKEIIGSYQSIDIEKIILLKPDLILTTKEGDLAQLVIKLRRLNIPVFVFSESINFDDLKKDFRHLGILLGRQNRAEQLIKTADRKVSDLRQQVSALPKIKVLVELNTAPLIVAGPNTFIDEIITSAGGINIARDTLSRWPQYSVEQVVLKNPEVIMITGMDQKTKKALKAWEKFPQVNAVKNKKIHVIDSNQICQPSINNFLESLKTIIKLLHPDLKNE